MLPVTGTSLALHEASACSVVRVIEQPVLTIASSISGLLRAMHLALYAAACQRASLTDCPPPLQLALRGCVPPPAVCLPGHQPMVSVAWQLSSLPNEKDALHDRFVGGLRNLNSANMNEALHTGGARAAGRGCSHGQKRRPTAPRGAQGAQKELVFPMSPYTITCITPLPSHYSRWRSVMSCNGMPR